MPIKNHLKAVIERHVFLLAFAIGSIIIAGSFVLSYNSFGHDGLPIGWDTPHYIGQIKTILSDGFPFFIQKNEFYNFMYAGISASISAAGVSPITMEVLFPIILGICLLGASGYFAKKYLGNTEAAVYTILLTTTWFGLYRVGTDLHPNLLALVLLIAALSLFPPWTRDNKFSRLNRSIFYILLLIASFVHIETALLFSFITLITSIIYELKISSKFTLTRIFKHTFPIILALLPGFSLYYIHMINLINHSGGDPVFQPPLPANLWFTYLGFLLPLSIVGFYFLLRKSPVNDAGETKPLAFPYRTFICTWALASIAIASIDYIIPSFSIFSERALMLFPTPFLAALGLKTILDRARKRILPRFPKLKRSIIVLPVLILLLTSGWYITYTSVVNHQQVWLSQPAYQKLTWLSNNYLSEKPIFIYNDNDEYAGGMATLWDNWVQAIYGDHYSYVGRLDFLLAKQETPFRSAVSKTVSSIFVDGIIKDGLFENNMILNHEIIIVGDFYRLGDLKKEYQGILKQVSEGIFVVDMQEVGNMQINQISLYQSIYELSGNWYGAEYNWTNSKYALEFWDPNPSDVAYFDALIPIASQGKYTLSLRYNDGSASDLLMELNGTSVGRIHYEQTGEPRVFKTSAMMAQGIYRLRISLEYAQGIPQYASLDYVRITKE